jgi:hypothetical protein
LREGFLSSLFSPAKGMRLYMAMIVDPVEIFELRSLCEQE